MLLLTAALAACGDRADPGAHAADPEPAPPTFRVVSFNVWGVPIAADLAARFQRLPAALRQQEADVLCLQEVWTRKQRDDLAAALAPTYTMAAPDRGGLLLASRHAISVAAFTPFSASEGLSLVERVAGKGWLEAVVELPGGPVRVVTTHLAHRGPREQQLAELLDALVSKRDLPLVLAGDFNLDANHPAFARARDLGLRHARAHEDGSVPEGPPTRVGWPRLPGEVGSGWRPDHVLVRGLACAAEGLACEAHETALSDHNLLWVEVRRDAGSTGPGPRGP